MGKEKTEALKREIDELLKAAVAEGDYREVTRLAKIAEEAVFLEEREKEISERRHRLFAVLNKSGKNAAHSENSTVRAQASARKRGSRVRHHYVNSVLSSEGISFERLASKKYRSASGLVVGIPYARQLDIRGPSWFLGLADEDFDCVILLCEQADTEEIVAFVFPPEFVKRIWKTLSRSEGQVKFHITRSTTTYELRLPGPSRIPINPYINATHILK